MRAPLYFLLWVSWIGGPCSWGTPSSPQSHPTWSLHALGSSQQSGNTSLLCKPAGKLKKQTYITLIGSAPLEWKMPREGLPQGTKGITGVSAGAELTQPEGTRCRVMLEPGTGHLHPLLHLEGDFAPSGLWQWQLREIHPKGATKYLGFLRCGTLAPSPAGALRRSLCLPGEDINLSQTILAVRLISLRKGKRSKIIFHRTEQPWIHSTLPYSHNCMKLAILKILIWLTNQHSSGFFQIFTLFSCKTKNPSGKSSQPTERKSHCWAETASPWKEWVSTPWEVAARPELSSANLLVGHEPQNNPAPSPWLYRFH